MAPVGFLTIFVDRLGGSAAQDRPPLARRPAWLGESEQPLTGALLADQTQRGLGALVGLGEHRGAGLDENVPAGDRKSTRLNSSHSQISYAVFCLKKKTA